MCIAVLSIALSVFRWRVIHASQSATEVILAGTATSWTPYRPVELFAVFFHTSPVHLFVNLALLLATGIVIEQYYGLIETSVLFAFTAYPTIPLYFFRQTRKAWIIGSSTACFGFTAVAGLLIAYRIGYRWNWASDDPRVDWAIVLIMLGGAIATLLPLSTALHLLGVYEAESVISNRTISHGSHLMGWALGVLFFTLTEGLAAIVSD